ncbi:hypothetical protein BOX15_Mlig031987g1 [Macrostomum lignano]|uniref:Uncharacterized protein n=1 Tax=Macrostomum lignano TaxID=282301 RepID=A0A267DGE0_9PLAT|nr:hypothetical protein BOX15_Mlig031987g1 [Macrostomum lignano]
MERVRRLHSKCKGNPFIVSIFGGLLRGRLSQFERYLKKFKTDLFKKVDLELGDYEYGSIIDAILVSIDDLDEEQKERYLHLSIFPEDTFLSARFLSTYCWRDEDGNPLSVDDSLDVMEGFVRRSIATIEKYRPNEELLTLHDLIVSAMKSEYKEKQTSFNNQFVERVLSHRETMGSWMDVDSNDQIHYLAYNFVYHLVGSDAVLLDRKLSILRDFDFISWLCCRIGAENLTFVYQYSIKILMIDESARKSLTDFVEFFRSPILHIQATNLATRRSDSAVIQLALTLPDENSVRECAVEAAKKHRQFFCFYYWLNVDQTEEQIYNTFKVDSDVSTFALDRDCKHAVVASDSSAVVLDLKTGLRNFRVRKEDMACSSARGDAQDSIQIVSALFSPDNQSLLVLTEFALFRFKLPPSAFEVGIRPSPAAPLPSEKGSLHFPQGRPRSGTTEKSPLELTPNKPVYKEEDKENSFFTAMCFESDAKLLVGSSDGNIKVFTLADRVTNLSSEFDIDQNIPAGAQSQINHIAASQSMYSTSIAVSGPNDCVYVYKSRFDIKKYSGHTKNSNPIRCAFEPRPEPRFAASIANNEIHLWHPETQQMLVREFGPKSTSFTSIAISSEGVYIAVGTSTRAHIYLYRVENLTESSCRLQLVDELNGSGSITKCLAFQTLGKSFLYSISEMSTEGVLTCWQTSLSTTPFYADDQRSSSIFFGPENATLRLRTVIDAVNVNGEIVVACQSVRRSLLILKSSGNHLQNDESGKLSGKEHPFSKAAAIRIAPTGNYAVFTFSNEVVIAKRFNDVWTFDFKPINVEIVDIVFLPNCQGFIGSNRSNKLVEFHDSLCVKQVDLSHKQLYSIDSVQPPANVAALLLFDRGWNYLLPDSLCVNENFGGSIGDQLQESLLCCNFCPALSGFVAGGTDLGNLILWKVAADNTASILATRSRIEDESRNCSLRCLQFSHQIIQDCYLLAAAFDDDRFSLWALRDGHLIDLVNCQPVQIGLPQQPSNIGCIAWTMHTDEDGTRHHKLIIASDCVHVCCLPEQEILGAARLAPQTPNLKLGTVSLYSRQSVSKVHVLNNGQDLLFVDNSHTVFWMRTLHSEDGAGPARQECSVPLIPFGESQEV